MNKTFLIALLIAVAIAGGVYIYKAKHPGMKSPMYSASPSPSKSPVSGKGEVIFEVTDKAIDMKSISEVELTMSRMELYSSVKGWVTVSEKPKTYKLLQLNSSSQLAFAAKTNIDAGTYTNIRLLIDKVVVKTKSGTMATAKLPSNAFTVSVNTLVNADETSSVKLDFLADKSLHTAVSGEYVFAPVVGIEERTNTTATTDAQGMVTISGGSVTSNTMFGMDLDGTMKLNFQLDANAVIKLEGGILKLNTTGSVNY